MNIRFFNKDFKNMSSYQKVAALLLIPVVITIAMSVTAIRFLKPRRT